jgi:hypothetical protein
MENLLAAQKPFSAPPPNCNTSLDTLNLERLLSDLPTRSTTLRAERGSSPSGMTLVRFPCSPIAATAPKLVESAKDAGSGNSIMKPMKPPQKPWTSRTGKHNSPGPVLDQTTVRPQGSYGFGILLQWVRYSDFACGSITDGISPVHLAGPTTTANLRGVLAFPIPHGEQSHTRK